MVPTRREVSIQIKQSNLSVSDGDDVGGDVGRHVTSLGLDDGQSGEGAAPEVVVHLCGSLQQTGVKVEDITWVGLTTRRTAQQQRHLTVGNGLGEKGQESCLIWFLRTHGTTSLIFTLPSLYLLGQIVVDDQSVLAIVSEVLSHGAARVGGQVLQGGGIRGRSRDHDGVLHGISVSQPLHQLSHGGPLLSNGHVDTVQLLLLFSALIEALLVDDCVNSDGCFAEEQ